MASLLVTATDRRDQLQRRADALELLYKRAAAMLPSPQATSVRLQIETAEPERSMNKRRITALLQLLAVPVLHQCQGAARMSAPTRSSHSMTDRRQAAHSLKQPSKASHSASQ